MGDENHEAEKMTLPSPSGCMKVAQTATKFGCAVEGLLGGQLPDLFVKAHRVGEPVHRQQLRV